LKIDNSESIYDSISIAQDKLGELNKEEEKKKRKTIHTWVLEVLSQIEMKRKRIMIKNKERKFLVFSKRVKKNCFLSLALCVRIFISKRQQL
jgi:hypothetical protein